jgi:hypothetical protein
VDNMQMDEAREESWDHWREKIAEGMAALA